MIKPNVIFFTCAFFGLCYSSAIVQKLNKCKISDSECQKHLYRTIIQEAAENGIKELGIPVIDPYVLKNVDITYFGLLKYTLVDATLEGFKTCRSESYVVDIENKRSKIKYVCKKFVIKGQYKLRPTKNLDAITGGIKITGDGKKTLTVENLVLDLDFPIAVEKLDDGEFHLVVNPEDSRYTFEAGKVSVIADNLFVGSQDVITPAVNIFHEYSASLSKTLLPPIVEKGFEVFYNLLEKIFKKIPAKDLIIDDLSAFVKH